MAETRDAMKLPGILSALLCLAPELPVVAERAGVSEHFCACTQHKKFIPSRAISRPPATPAGISGLSFDLPADVQLEPVPRPVAHDGRIQMLQLAGPPPAYAAVSIFAVPLRAKTAPDAKAILRKALDQELFYGVEELHGLSKTTLAGRLFYFYETRRGAEQHMAFAGQPRRLCGSNGGGGEQREDGQRARVGIPAIDVRCVLQSS